MEEPTVKTTKIVISNRKRYLPELYQCKIGMYLLRFGLLNKLVFIKLVCSQFVKLLLNISHVPTVNKIKYGVY